MDRRTFLLLSGAGLAKLGLGATGCAVDDGADDDAPIDLGPALPRRVPASLVTTRALELDVTLNVLAGRVPLDLYGHVFVTAPVPQPGVHVFNGEAMLYRLDLESLGVKSRLLRTPCHYLDVATAGGEQAFRNLGMARMSGALGFRAMPNTTPVSLGADRLLCAVDASRPWEVDPVSLEVVTAMGGMDEWRAALPPGLFSGPFQPVFTPAHPCFDEHTGEVFAVDYALPLPNATKFARLIRWDRAGALEAYPLVLPGGGPVEIAQTAHQVAVTADHVLIIDTAFVVEGEQALGQDVSRAQAAETVLYLVRRDDLGAPGGEVEARRVTLPREAAHVVADYDDGDGQIVLHLAHLCATDLSEWLRADDVRADDGAAVRADLHGLFASGADRNHLGRHVIDAASATVTSSQLVDDDQLTWATLLYMHRGQQAHDRFEHMYYASFGFHAELLTRRVHDLYADYPHRTVPTSALPYADGRPGALLRLDTADMVIADGYRLPDGRVLSSPQFAPRRGRDGATEGYLVATVSSDDTSTPGSSGDELWIFDAADLARGPLCRLGHPDLDFGFTIHTTWAPAIAPRTSPYRVRARDDYAAAVASLPPELQAVFEAEVYPRFGG